MFKRLYAFSCNLWLKVGGLYALQPLYILAQRKQYYLKTMWVKLWNIDKFDWKWGGAYALQPLYTLAQRTQYYLKTVWVKLWKIDKFRNLSYNLINAFKMSSWSPLQESMNLLCCWLERWKFSHFLLGMVEIAPVKEAWDPAVPGIHHKSPNNEI